MGSTPTGVSDHPTASPDYIDLGSRNVSGHRLRRTVTIHAQLTAGTTSRLLTWCHKHRCLSTPSLGLAFRQRANRGRGKRVLGSAQLPAGTTSTISTCLGNNFVGPLRRTQTVTAGMNPRLRRRGNKDRLPIGVHACKAAGCGFESHRLRLISRGRSSNGRAAKASDQHLVDPCNTRSTAGVEYMVTRFDS